MTDTVAERYRRFAEDEAPGRSDVYARWATAVVEDPALQGVLARIPEQSRQPPLVFAVTRLLGAGVGDADEWRAFVLATADEIVAECSSRRLQTNEPLRLAPLLPVLSEIEGPLALLEVGASAGLCLYPDRYSYRVTDDDDGRVLRELHPDDGPSSVLLQSSTGGIVPRMRMPEVVWRAGIDLAPLDATVDRDRRWLQGLVWPGETGREERVTAALDIAALDPPYLVAGDALERIDALAAQAPADATLVVTTPGVLVHIPRPAREQLIDRIRTLPARWLTIDPPALLDLWRPEVDAGSWPGFVVALDGQVRAAADPLGRWWEWRAGEGTAAT